MKRVLQLIIIVLCFNSYAQLVNSNKENIGEFFNSKSDVITLNKGKVGLKVRVGKKEIPFKLKKDTVQLDDKIVRTALKLDGHFVNFEVVDSKSFVSLNQFKWKSLGLRAGYEFQHSTDRVYTTKNDTSSIIVPKLQIWKLGGNFGYDRFDNYDPLTSQIKNELAWRITVEGSYNRYWFSDNIDASGITTILAINGKLNVVDYNNLTNYIENGNINNNGTISITDNTSFDGKFGTIENDRVSSFLSVSTPLVSNMPFTINDRKYFHFAVIPHFSWQGKYTSESKDVLNTGVNFGFLSKSIFGKSKVDEFKYIEDNTKKSGKGYYREFRSPSFFTFGVDYNIQGGKNRNLQYYVSGTFIF